MMLVSRSYLSIGNSAMGSMCCIPAMLATKRRSPSSAAASTTASTSPSSVRSVSTPWKVPGASNSSAMSAVSSSPSASMSAPTTVSPLAASPTAVARPMPEAAPVTTATLSVSKYGSSIRRKSPSVSSGAESSMSESAISYHSDNYSVAVVLTPSHVQVTQSPRRAGLLYRPLDEQLQAEHQRADGPEDETESRLHQFAREVLASPGPDGAAHEDARNRPRDDVPHGRRGQ